MSTEQQRRSAFVVMVFAVLCGAVIAGAIGIFVMPGLAPALALGGAMTGGAVAAAFYLFFGADQ